MLVDLCEAVLNKMPVLDRTSDFFGCKFAPF